MIIFDGDKYSCAACIRGHRSSICRHTDRMLVKVRTRGRPSQIDIRKAILVDERSKISSLDTEPSTKNPKVSECCVNPSRKTANSCLGMENQPILFLKALKTQKALMVDGALKIMVDESSNNECGEKKFNLITEKEFLLKHVDKCTRNDDTNDEQGYLEERSINVINACEIDSDNSKHKIGDEFEFSSVVKAFTYEGVYFSTQCSCEDENCLCENCLIHRREDELNKFIEDSGVSMTLLGIDRKSQVFSMPTQGEVLQNHSMEEGIKAHDDDKVSQPLSFEHNYHDMIGLPHKCRSNSEQCIYVNCTEHPQQVVSINKILLHGILNLDLKKKSFIKYRGKLIDSQYWWDFFNIQVLMMSEIQHEMLDLLQWFDNIILQHGNTLPDA